ncbi:hypothetical protein [Patulibacter sp. SYSU D01012]|uniref:hypothetical protein n=1 Tax=Patulibacter sp. SYSU D01012 TaxID=2817381 RepID=UPI001B30AE7F|nr:hypothetical protein [Patulibacter sp. SYSU D01012]
MLVRRAVALLALLAGLLATQAAPAGASSPTAPLGLDPDGTLHWTLNGSSDSINVLPHLRCAADPTASGPFAGAKVPCVWLVDHKAPLVAAPDGCVGTGDPYASWRCDMRRFRALVIDAATAGEESLVMFNTKAKGGSGVCAWIPVAVRLHGGRGQLQADDGCPERITCERGYAGTVRADAFDVVGGDCRRVVRTRGTSSGGSSAGGSGGSGVDLSQCEGAGGSKKGMSPLYDIRTIARGKRGWKVRLTMRRAAPVTIEVRRKASYGTQLVRAYPRCAKRGVSTMTVPDATGGRKGPARYRVVVRSSVSAYPLVSSYERLPR